jgi:hypothetical protein
MWSIFFIILEAVYILNINCSVSECCDINVLCVVRTQNFNHGSTALSQQTYQYDRNCDHRVTSGSLSVGRDSKGNL